MLRLKQDLEHSRTDKDDLNEELRSAKKEIVRLNEVSNYSRWLVGDKEQEIRSVRRSAPRHIGDSCAY